MLSHVNVRSSHRRAWAGVSSVDIRDFSNDGEGAQGPSTSLGMIGFARGVRRCRLKRTHIVRGSGWARRKVSRLSAETLTSLFCVFSAANRTPWRTQCRSRAHRRGAWHRRAGKCARCSASCRCTDEGHVAALAVAFGRDFADEYGVHRHSTDRRSGQHGGTLIVMRAPLHENAGGLDGKRLAIERN